MTQDAPVETRHKDEAAKAAGYSVGPRTMEVMRQHNRTSYDSILAHAQTLANNEQLRCDLEAMTASCRTANNRLAEIDRIAKIDRWEEFPGCARPGSVSAVAALASGHTKTQCSDCALKDEAMEAMRADLVEIDKQLLKLRVRGGSWPEGAEVYAAADIAAKYRPPADPVAEALEATAEAIYVAAGGSCWEQSAKDYYRRMATAALAELKSRLSSDEVSKLEGPK